MHQKEVNQETKWWCRRLLWQCTVGWGGQPGLTPVLDSVNACGKLAVAVIDWVVLDGETMTPKFKSKLLLEWWPSYGKLSNGLGIKVVSLFQTVPPGSKDETFTKKYPETVPKQSEYSEENRNWWKQNGKVCKGMKPFVVIISVEGWCDGQKSWPRSGLRGSRGRTLLKGSEGKEVKAV